LKKKTLLAIEVSMVARVTTTTTTTTTREGCTTTITWVARLHTSNRGRFQSRGRRRSLHRRLR